MPTRSKPESEPTDDAPHPAAAAKKKQAEKAGSTALATIPEGAVFAAFDRMDEAMIIADMRGQLLDKYVYSYKQGGQQITELSWIGTREASRKHGGIQVDLANNPQIIKQGDKDLWLINIKATDVRTASSRIGGATQPILMSLKDGRMLPDDYAYQKALSKAERNAIKQLIPTEVIAKLIEVYIKQGKVHVIDEQEVAPAAAAPVAFTPENKPTPEQWKTIAELNNTLPDDKKWGKPKLIAELGGKGFENTLKKMADAHIHAHGQDDPHIAVAVAKNVTPVEEAPLGEGDVDENSLPI